MLTATRDEGSPRTGVAPVSAPTFWAVVVRLCRCCITLTRQTLVAALCDRSRDRDGEHVLRCRDSTTRGFRRSCISSHDVGDVVSMRQDHGFEEPVMPLGPSPGQDVVAADLPSRIQGVEAARESLAKVAEATELGLV